VARWLVPLALPLAGLALLLAWPSADAHWEHHPSHFWLVVLVGFVNLGIGLLAGDAARRRGDARLVLVSLAFMAAAGFLGLHALATPGVLLDAPNAGFVIATPIGLLLAAALAAASSLDLEPRAEWLVRRQRALGVVVLAVIAAWAVVSLTALPPLDKALGEDRADTILVSLGVPGVALYAFAAWRYLELYRRCPAPVLLSLVAAFALLAEAMVAVALGRNWHASWWEWHVLMAMAFGLVAWTIRVEYRRQGSAAGAFSALYLERTVERVDRRSAERLDALVAALGRGEPTDDLLARFRERDRLSTEDTTLLLRAAREIVALDDLFRPYLSPQLAERLREQPELAELGGVEREVSVLFADLQGYTAFSEGRSPAEVIGMLNRYWSATVPVTIEHGGTIERFAGDAIMAVFNITGDQPDHAPRAARAALGLQRAAAELAAAPDWPRFRVGVNTGPAIVGNVGSAEQRSFTAIGDTTNLASRLQTLAQPGQVVLGATTVAELGAGSRVESLGRVEVKGKRAPIEAFVLLELAPLGSGPTQQKGA
jgi:adenylate cyclase